MNEKDLRVIRTRQNLMNTLHRLLLKEPFSKVTVSQIVHEALINRATFYAHFHDKYDLLESTLGSLTDNVLDIPASQLIQQPFETFFSTVTPDFWDLFHKQLIDTDFRDVFKTFITNRFKHKIESLPPNTLDELSVFIFLATIRGLIDWVDARQDVDEMEAFQIPQRLDTYFQHLFQLKNID